jgi:two-component system sensor histidine kinase RstB
MEMLAEEDDYNYRIQQVDMIDKDIEALNTLIDEIMTYAKLEQGTPSLDFEDVVLVEVLDQVAMETEALKTQKEIELIAPPLSLSVDAERRYLHRVVQNLVGNAVRYCDHKVRISGGVRADGKAYVCVEDDGPVFQSKSAHVFLKPLLVWMIVVHAHQVGMVWVYQS